MKAARRLVLDVPDVENPIAVAQTALQPKLERDATSTAARISNSAVIDMSRSGMTSHDDGPAKWRSGQVKVNKRTNGGGMFSAAKKQKLSSSSSSTATLTNKKTPSDDVGPSFFCTEIE
jgi:hypothetical protein